MSVYVAGMENMKSLLCLSVFIQVTWTCPTTPQLLDKQLSTCYSVTYTEPVHPWHTDKKKDQQNGQYNNMKGFQDK